MGHLQRYLPSQSIQPGWSEVFYASILGLITLQHERRCVYYTAMTIVNRSPLSCLCSKVGTSSLSSLFSYVRANKVGASLGRCPVKCISWALDVGVWSITRQNQIFVTTVVAGDTRSGVSSLPLAVDTVLGLLRYEVDHSAHVRKR
ncbi:hypothetical protein E2C01_077375 [Portunus trituberculatus]|uniref:Uncharacterized protein n=1 Tax=Portunus trituberculatus TaxID=210409 RepID=A0A5B7IK45_PORTR|nr:hypothetical protein [Portunus trituberculatus]